MNARGKVAAAGVSNEDRHSEQSRLGQYLTPPAIAEFMVRLVNPGAADRIVDPACGGADLLIAAAKVAQSGKAGSPQLYGFDLSEAAVALSESTLRSHQCGSVQVTRADSLSDLRHLAGQFNVCLCNPPFGSRLLERRRDVLAEFELAQRWEKRETGMLFSELCLRLLEPGGRGAIVLPNGYLGNQGDPYYEFRSWLLRHARIAAIIGLPRFAFKVARGTGADVSASVVVFKRKERPRKIGSYAEKAQDDPVYFGVVEVPDRILQRRPRLHGRDLRIADFDQVFIDLRKSRALTAFPWLGGGYRDAGDAPPAAAPR